MSKYLDLRILRFILNTPSLIHFSQSNPILSSGIKKLLATSKDLYDKEFDTKTYHEIFDMIIVRKKRIKDLDQSDFARMDRFQKFSFFSGDQFDTVNHIIFSKDNHYHFIWAIIDDYNTLLPIFKDIKYVKVESSFLEVVFESYLLHSGE